MRLESFKQGFSFNRNKVITGKKDINLDGFLKIRKEILGALANGIKAGSGEIKSAVEEVQLAHGNISKNIYNAKHGKKKHTGKKGIGAIKKPSKPDAGFFKVFGKHDATKHKGKAAKKKAGTKKNCVWVFAPLCKAPTKDVAVFHQWKKEAKDSGSETDTATEEY